MLEDSDHRTSGMRDFGSLTKERSWKSNKQDAGAAAKCSETQYERERMPTNFHSTTPPGVAFGREGLTQVLALVNTVRVAPADAETSGKSSVDNSNPISSADGIDSRRASGSDDGGGGGGGGGAQVSDSMFLGVDAEVFQHALLAEQQSCSDILEVLQRGVHELLDQYQLHARNTSVVRFKEEEADQLRAANDKLLLDLQTSQKQTEDVFRKLEMCSSDLKKATREKALADRSNADLTISLKASSERLSDLQVRSRAKTCMKNAAKVY